MRVLSFIPAFLLAAASFVAAAPTPTPDNSCVTSPSGGSGSDAGLQPVITILTTATSDLQPLSDQLTALLNGGSGACTSDAVDGIVVKITAVVSTCVDSLKASASVNLDGVILVNLCAAVYGLLELVASILSTLVGILAIIGVEAVVSVQASICALLNIIVSLGVCLKVFAVGSIASVLGPVIVVVTGLVKLCLSVVVQVHVSA